MSSTMTTVPYPKTADVTPEFLVNPFPELNHLQVNAIIKPPIVRLGEWHQAKPSVFVELTLSSYEDIGCAKPPESL